MKKTMDAQLRKEVKPLRKRSGIRQKLEAKLERVLADIGWICGWRKDRLVKAAVVRRSSRRRMMLDRALADQAQVHENEALRRIEVSSSRKTDLDAKDGVEASVLFDLALDLQSELVQLSRMGVDASGVVQGLADAGLRTGGRQL